MWRRSYICALGRGCQCNAARIIDVAMQPSPPICVETCRVVQSCLFGRLTKSRLHFSQLQDIPRVSLASGVSAMTMSYVASFPALFTEISTLSRLGSIRLSKGPGRRQDADKPQQPDLDVGNSACVFHSSSRSASSPSSCVGVDQNARR